jgi:hypothetical protein
MGLQGTNAEIIVQGTVATSGGGSKQFVNAFHVQTAAAVPATTKAQLWTGFAAAIWTPLAAFLSVDYVGSAASVRWMDNALDIPVVTGVPANGGTALPRLDTALAVTLLLRTNNKGRSYRGSKHFGPIATADVLKDELTAGALVNWHAVLATITGVFATAADTYYCTVYSRKLSQPLVNPTTIINTAIQASSRVNKTIGTMRRRKERTNF